MLSRRELLETVSKAAVASIALPPFFERWAEPLLAVVAGPDRVVIEGGKTYLNAWAEYGDTPRVTWSKEAGPGHVRFADAHALVTTATFSALGAYVLRLTATEGESQAVSTFRVTVEAPPPDQPLEAVVTGPYRIDSRLWKQRSKALIVSWIPHCVEQINRTDLEQGEGGIDNFVEAAKALAGRPHGRHKGYVFSNAWVLQAVESMSLALMVDPQGDEEIAAAQANMRSTLDDWIPKILDGRAHV